MQVAAPAPVVTAGSVEYSNARDCCSHDCRSAGCDCAFTTTLVAATASASNPIAVQRHPVEPAARSERHGVQHCISLATLRCCSCLVLLLARS